MARLLEMAGFGTAMTEPELKVSKNGNPYCAVSLAVEAAMDVGGKPVSQLVRIVAFGDVGTTFARTASKGSRAYFEGTVTFGIWKPENGEPRVNVNVTAWLLMKTGNIGRNRQRPPTARPDSQRPIEPARQTRSPPAFELEHTEGMHDTGTPWFESGDALSDLGPAWR